MHPATVPETAAPIPCRQLMTVGYLQWGRFTQQRVEKGKQELFEKLWLSCQVKLLRKWWGKATRDERKAEAKLGGTHSPPAEDWTRGSVSSADGVPCRQLTTKPPRHALLSHTADVPKCYFDRRVPCKIPHLASLTEINPVTSFKVLQLRVRHNLSHVFSS